MKDVVFNSGTLSVYLDMAPDQVKQVVVSRKGGVYGEVFLRQEEDGKDAIPVEWIENEIKWLESVDNAFSAWSAGQIKVLLKHWREKDGIIKKKE